MNVFKCDICGIETYMNPPHVVEKDKQGQALTAKQKRQNTFTGEVEVIDVPKVTYTKEKTYLVQLQVGSERIQKDFCRACLNIILEDAKKLWNTLESVESK